jgi:hypothetical protein
MMNAILIQDTIQAQLKMSTFEDQKDWTTKIFGKMLKWITNPFMQSADGR